MTAYDIGIAGTYVLACVLLACIVLGLGLLAATSSGPSWRCQHCSAELPSWDLLLAHEEQHGHGVDL